MLIFAVKKHLSKVKNGAKKLLGILSNKKIFTIFLSSSLLLLLLAIALFTYFTVHPKKTEINKANITLVSTTSAVASTTLTTAAAEAEAVEESSEWKADNVRDDNLQTVWSSEASTNQNRQEWITVNFDGFYEISEVELYPQEEGVAFPTDFKLQYTVDNFPTWIDIPGQAYSNYPKPGGAVKLSFSPVKAKMIRVLASKLAAGGSSGSYDFQLADINAYGRKFEVGFKVTLMGMQSGSECKEVADEKATAILNDDLGIDITNLKGPKSVPGTYLKLLRSRGIDPTKIDYLLITHWHGDHLDLAAVQDLVNARGDKAEPLKIYGGSTDTVANVNGWAQSMGLTSKVVGIDLPYWQETQIGRYKVTAVKAQHGPPSGYTYNPSWWQPRYYIIEYMGKKMLYATDSGYFLKETYKYFRNIKLDLVVMDGTFGRGGAGNKACDTSKAGSVDNPNLLFGHNGFSMAGEIRQKLINQGTIAKDTEFIFTHSWCICYCFPGVSGGKGCRPRIVKLGEDTGNGMYLLRSGDQLALVGEVASPTITPTPTPTPNPTDNPPTSVPTATPTPTVIPTSVPTSEPTTPTPTPTSIAKVVANVYASGTSTDSQYPTMELKLNGATICQWKNVKKYTGYTCTLKRVDKSSDLRVALINASFVSSVKRVLTVDKIVISGKTFETEDPSTYSYRVKPFQPWCQDDDYLKTESTECNGDFKYNLSSL